MGLLLLPQWIYAVERVSFSTINVSIKTESHLASTLKIMELNQRGPISELEFLELMLEIQL